MNEKNLSAQVAELRRIVDRHEERITAVEAKLDPKGDMSTAVLDALLNELEEML